MGKMRNMGGVAATANVGHLGHKTLLFVLLVPFRG